MIHALFLLNLEQLDNNRSQKRSNFGKNVKDTWLDLLCYKCYCPLLEDANYDLEKNELSNILNSMSFKFV